MHGPIRWPDGKDFAFTIFDDCDYQTAENVRAVYDFITEIGLRTTKTVWTVRGSEKPREKVTNGSTCDDEAYLKWALDLQELGFEIALHNVSYHTSPRERTLRGMAQFRKWFGHDPHCLANHSRCQEGIYWGAARLTGLQRTFYNLVHRNRRRNEAFIRQGEWFFVPMRRNIAASPLLILRNEPLRRGEDVIQPLNRIGDIEGCERHENG